MSILIRALFLSGVALSVQASPVAPLQNFVNQLNTFSADFTQTQPEEELFKSNESNGTFLLKRPGQLVWQYTKPEQQVITIDGANVWVYDADLDQVTVRAVSEIQNDLPLSWLLFNEPIEAKYTIIKGSNLRGIQWFNLAPKSNTFFQSIDVGMKDGVLTEVHMYQTANNVTKVRFHNIKVNPAIPEQRFEFKAPKGVDMIGQPQ